MYYHPENPIIVQSDKTVMLEVNNKKYENARDNLSKFAELEKSPEHIHTFRISSLSLWNAAASSLNADQIIRFLEEYSKYDIPDSIKKDIKDTMSRYGKVKLIKENGQLMLTSDDRYILHEIENNKYIAKFITKRIDEKKLEVLNDKRGHIKQSLIKIGYPAEDLAGYVKGKAMEFKIRKKTISGGNFGLRSYQKDAADTFYAGGALSGGSGVIVLPCGAGKTMVGIGVMEKVKCETLILTTNITAVRQWIDELVDKTYAARDMIGEYTGETKEIKPITIATYQILTHRNDKNGEFPHFKLLNANDWGLIIYDEVHLLPAPVFRATAEIQATRRLGLTATLIREDGLEQDVFTLIGPKKYDVPWKDLEQQGWIATAKCFEIRISLIDSLRMKYASSNSREQFRIASENPAKIKVISKLLNKHKDDHVLIIGQYINQLMLISNEFNAPVITGKTKQDERIRLYNLFKEGKIKLLIVSKVANFAIDLPDANVAIQISGTFGSRQEEAQRLGRILRPKKDGSYANFYSIVTKETKDQDYAANRQLFLTEQGYKYNIYDGDDLENES